MIFSIQSREQDFKKWAELVYWPFPDMLILRWDVRLPSTLPTVQIAAAEAAAGWWENAKLGNLVTLSSLASYFGDLDPQSLKSCAFIYLFVKAHSAA